MSSYFVLKYSKVAKIAGTIGHTLTLGIPHILNRRSILDSLPHWFFLLFIINPRPEGYGSHFVVH